MGSFVKVFFGYSHLPDLEFIVETTIPKAQRSGIGKLNNPAKRRV
jgi:hypothetical protein